MEWHPVIDAVEGPTGAWHLLDASGARIGRIELRRVMNGAELRYRVEFRGDVIGWAVNLRTACERLNQAYLRTHGPGGGAMAETCLTPRMPHRQLQGELQHVKALNLVRWHGAQNHAWKTSLEVSRARRANAAR